MVDYDKFQNKKSDLQNIEQTINIKNNLVVKTTIVNLMKTIPLFGDLLNNTIDTVLADFQQKKRKQFLDIISNDTNITKEMVNDIEFIMEFAKTLEAINRVTMNEKVKYFANLFKNSYCKEKRIETDIYDEYLRALENLSFREIEYLCFLKKFELSHKPDKKNERNKNYWYNFMDEFSNEFGVTKYEYYESYKRLIRCGFVDELLKYDGDIEVGEHELEGDYKISYIEDDLEYFYTTDYFDGFYSKIIK